MNDIKSDEVGKKLKDVLPQEFLSDFEDSKANKHLEETVIGVYIGGWQGKHKNVISNGYAVGWNENPSIGWSFPVIKLK